MPTNLPPEALEAEQRYREAQDIEEKIARLEEYISKIPKHKGTDKLRANLRKRLSKLKDAKQTSKGAERHVSVFHVNREGAGQVAVIGPPNTGKSALVATLTNATPEVAIYPYTTWTPTPGMMLIDNIQVQLIDTPPLSDEYIEPELINLIHRADLILLVVDIQAPTIQQIEDTIALLEEHYIAPEAHRAQYAEPQRFTFHPLLVVVNKCDDETADEDFSVLCELLGDVWTLLPLSVNKGRYFDQLREAVFNRLAIMRIYAKPPGREADRSAPFVMPRGSTVEEFAAKVHKDFVRNLQSARVWGTDVYDGQQVGRDHVLHDEDIVELRT